MIKLNNLPLTQQDRAEIEDVLRHPGFQKVKQLIWSHAASLTVEAGVEMVNTDGGEKVEVGELARKAFILSQAYETLCQIEAGEFEQYKFNVITTPLSL